MADILYFLHENPLLVTAAAALASFLIGALPFGLWAGLARGVDIRTLGSKNIGATNVLRVLGPGPGSLVFALDTLKGAVMILAARWLWVAAIPHAQGSPAWPLLTPAAMPAQILIGLCAVLGHTFSPFLRFKGGKGIATSLGMLLALSWQVALIGLGVWIVVVLLTRYVSLASLAAALCMPISSACLLRGTDRAWMVGVTLALLVLVTVKHRANIQRLLAGTEAKFGQRVATPPDAPAPREEATDA